MAQIRKPVPKTQKEISIDLQTPSDPRYGNPNIASNPNESETGINFNRSEKLSWTGDTAKPFSIGIKDIDEAVFYYFKNVIKPFVYQNGERRNVPVIYGAPERWKSFQKDGYYRDKKGAIMLPIIVIKRDTILNPPNYNNKFIITNPPYLARNKSKDKTLFKQIDEKLQNNIEIELTIQVIGKRFEKNDSEIFVIGKLIKLN